MARWAGVSQATSRSARWRFGRAALVFLGLGVVVAAGVGIALALWAQRASTPPELPVLWRAPSFVLHDQAGRSVTDGDLRGRVVVANFIFTRCTDVCPIYLTPKMREVQRLLRERGIGEGQAQLVSFSVDPEYDTPEVLAVYAARYGADGRLWRFLTGSRSAMEEVARGFAVPMDPVPSAVAGQHKHTPDVPPTIIHSGRFVLLDRQWRVRVLYRADEVTPAEIVRGVEALLREGGAPS